MTQSKLAFTGFLFTTALAICGCDFGTPLIGSGVATTETRELESFTRIDVGGALKVQAEISGTPSVEISGDDNIVPAIVTKVEDGTLRIYLEHAGRLETNQPLSIRIAAPTLTGTDVSGACNVSVTGITEGTFDIGLSGASKLILEGACDQLDAEISGASTLNSTDLKAARATVDVSGASKAEVYAVESIIGSASGASSIRYDGNPAKASVGTSGASSAKAAE